MKIDFDHNQGYQLAVTMQDILDSESQMQLVAMLRPQFTMEGNMYCFAYPNTDGLPNNCIQGFGDTAAEAARDFTNNFYSQKAHGGVATAQS